MLALCELAARPRGYDFTMNGSNLLAKCRALDEPAFH